MVRCSRRTARPFLALALSLSACALGFKKDEAAAQAPVNCATAQGDLRLLKQEKANVAEQIAMGVSMIYPAGLVVGLVTRTEDTKWQVASDEYNEAIDARIAEIKSKCGVS